MKKIWPAMIVLAAACLLGGCVRYEDMIPENFGEPDGLWLYRGLERMRTDGSETESLFGEIVLNGDIYTGNYDVLDYYYNTEEKIAFFVLRVYDGSLYGSSAYYVYDYVEKTGTQIGEMREHSARISATDSYVYFIEGYQTSTTVCTRDGTLVAELEGEYSIADDILWKYDWQDGSKAVVWWKNGAFHSAEVPYREGGFTVCYDGEYLYDCSMNGVNVIHSATEQMSTLTFDGTPYDYIEIGTQVYILTYDSHTVEDFHPFYGGSKMYRVTPSGVDLIYTFKSDWSMHFIRTDGVKGRCVNLGRAMMKRGRYVYDDYYLNLDSGKLKKGSAPRAEVTNKIECGGYTFWVESRHYGLFGWAECFYLYRSDGSKTEIMQYAFGDHGHVRPFYDDICEF